MAETKDFIDLSQPSLYISAASIIFNPLFWNTAARQQYHNQALTRLLNTTPHRGCYTLAIIIFSLGLLRDFLYARALEHQPPHPLLTPTHPANQSYLFRSEPAVPLIATLIPPLAYALILGGNILVLSSMYALGITGTYLGDYFGILMDEPVTSFPFSVMGAPMYWGSCFSFVGTALLWGRPAGLLLSVLVWACYRVALEFEDPFTAGIYARRDRERKEGKKGE